MSFLGLESVLEADSFRSLPGSRQFRGALRQSSQLSRSESERQPDAVERICSAVDMACIWYWKEALCLQRSAATACLLKKYRRAGADGHRRAADAVQSSRVGRSGRPRGQRQTVYAGNVRSARSVLKAFDLAERGQT